MTDQFELETHAFLAWFTALPGVSMNAKIELVDYRERGAGRGVRALRDIDADEDLFSVSRADIISVENSDLRRKLPNLFANLADPWISLILVLIYEHQLGQESKWKAYFDVLPKTFDTLMFWSDEELGELQASRVLHKIGGQEATSIFKDAVVPVIKNNLDVFRAATLSDEALLFLSHRMGSIIMAYAFDLEREEVQETDEDGYATEEEEEMLPKGMVPMADMLNADAEPNSGLFYRADMLTMKALRPISAGSELLNDYGQLPSSDLLRRYGYTTPQYARFDCVELSRKWLDSVIFKHYPEPSDLADRIAYLEDRQILDDTYDVVWPNNSGNMDFFPDDLSRYVKTMLADNERWKQVAKTGISDHTLMDKFETVMRDAIKQRLSQYSTSLEQDLELLDSQTSPSRHRTALQVRVGEKKILHEAVKRLQIRATSDEEPTNKRRRLG